MNFWNPFKPWYSNQESFFIYCPAYPYTFLGGSLREIPQAAPKIVIVFPVMLYYLALTSRVAVLAVSSYTNVTTYVPSVSITTFAPPAAPSTPKLTSQEAP